MLFFGGRASCWTLEQSVLHRYWQKMGCLRLVLLQQGVYLHWLWGGVQGSPVCTGTFLVLVEHFSCVQLYLVSICAKGSASWLDCVSKQPGLHGYLLGVNEMLQLRLAMPWGEGLVLFFEKKLGFSVCVGVHLFLAVSTMREGSLVCTGVFLVLV